MTEIAADRLRSLVDRVERLDEEIRALNGDKSEVFKEAKGDGFDVKIMKQVIRMRRMDKDDLDEQESLIDTYRRALGMLPDYEREGAGTPVATRARTEPEPGDGWLNVAEIERLAAEDARNGVMEPPTHYDATQLAAWGKGYSRECTEMRKRGEKSPTFPRAPTPFEVAAE